MMLFQFALLLICISNKPTNAEVGIKADSVSCTGDINLSDITLDCEDEYCNWGSDFDLTGNLTISNSLESEIATFTLKTSDFWFIKGHSLYSEEIDICSITDTSSGQYSSNCPEAGTYEFRIDDLTLPGDGDMFYSNFYGVQIPFRVQFDVQGSDDTNSQTSECTMGIEITKNGGYTLSSSAFQLTGGTIILVGFAGLMRMRRRRVALIELEQEEYTTSNFEMMAKDGSVRV